MKKLFIALMCMLLVACSNGVPKGYTKEAWEIAEKAIRIGEAYVEDKIDPIRAIDELNALRDKASALESVENEKYPKDGYLPAYISLMAVNIQSGEFQKYDVEETIELIKN